MMVNYNKIRKILAFVLVAAATVLLIVVVIRFTSIKKKDVLRSALPKNIDVSLQTLHYSEIRKGVKLWDLDAEKAELDKNREIVDMVKPKLVLYLSRDPKVIQVSADRARYNLTNRTVDLQGNVKAGGGEMSFATGRLTVVSDSSRIFTDDQVTASLGSSSVTGTGMEVRIDTGTVTLMNRVSATLAGKALHK